MGSCAWAADEATSATAINGAVAIAKFILVTAAVRTLTWSRAGRAPSPQRGEGRGEGHTSKRMLPLTRAFGATSPRWGEVEQAHSLRIARVHHARRPILLRRGELGRGRDELL